MHDVIGNLNIHFSNGSKFEIHSQKLDRIWGGLDFYEN